MNKVIIPLKDIEKVKVEFSRGRNTSIFGKSTYKILTSRKTYKITSEQYWNLNKLEKNLNLDRRTYNEN